MSCVTAAKCLCSSSTAHFLWQLSFCSELLQTLNSSFVACVIVLHVELCDSLPVSLQVNSGDCG